jgi:putative selenate reductase
MMPAVSELYPIPLATLVARLVREIDAGGPIFGLPRAAVWKPNPGSDISFEHFGQRAATPLGPASGPHTQLAQNLLISWLAGGRFMELKTVQILDELRLPRPCIHVPHVGYNVEWSQELRVEESGLEYVKGWYLVHLAAKRLGMDADCIFDLSLGYDLAGIREPRIVAFVHALQNAGPALQALRDALPADLQIDAPTRICRSMTLSTFHGCPAREIEAIAAHLMQEHGLDTVVKLNPTLLGLDTVTSLLHDQLGYTQITLDPHAFQKDLNWDQLLAMVPRLRAVAAAEGVGFGVKFTNTLVCRSPEPPFGDGEMYLSGPPLHVLAATLAARFRAVFGPAVPITFSAGIDANNFPDVIATGIRPVTTCTDLLKGKGYAKMITYLRALEKRMAGSGVSDLPAFAVQDPSFYAATLPGDARYHHDANRTAPRKVGASLTLLDCLTCDKCIPVCPNAAIFTFELPLGALPSGRLTWSDATFSVTPESGPPRTVFAPVTRRHQIGILADACNLCGQCDPTCPEDGGPFASKPVVFVDDRAWAEHPERDGFRFVDDALSWRRAGIVQTWAPGPDRSATWTLPAGVVQLDGDQPVATTGSGDADLTDAALLRHLHTSLRRADTWLPPSGA